MGTRILNSGIQTVNVPSLVIIYSSFSVVIVGYKNEVRLLCPSQSISANKIHQHISLSPSQSVYSQ